MFSLCGTPRLGRRSALPATSQFVFEKRLDKSHRPPARPVKSEFEKNLLDLKRRLKSAEGFWAQVPHQMCHDGTEKPQRNVRDQQSCWNGVEPGRYSAKVVEDGLCRTNVSSAEDLMVAEVERLERVSRRECYVSCGQDCKVSEWGGWSACSQSVCLPQLSVGARQRSRQIVQSARQPHGKCSPHLQQAG